MDSLPIANPFPGALSYLVRETGSTQEEAKRLGRAGLPSGSLVAAEIQSAGRGRFPERPWRSEPGLNLLFTLRLDASCAALPALPLRVGAALCKAARLQARGMGRGFRGGEARVKWPNDLLIGDRKAAGLLCEAGAEGVFVGIGVNCNQAAFPPEIEGKATSLAIELGAEIDRWAFLELVLGAIKAALEEEGWKAGVEELLWKRGELVRFMPGLPRGGGQEELIEGRLEGLDPSGAILIRPAGAAGAEAAPLAFAAGELSLP
jgi:BirA family biotin operon repressor/biotin-[acetyl-CoA-carboxylase] ligase